MHNQVTDPRIKPLKSHIQDILFSLRDLTDSQEKLTPLTERLNKAIPPPQATCTSGLDTKITPPILQAPRHNLDPTYGQKKFTPSTEKL